MTALASVADLEARLGVQTGELQGTDLARAEAALDDVSVEVLSVSGADWNAQSAPARVKVIVLAAAKGIWDNPEGLAGEQIGDYSWRTNSPRGGELLTDAQRRAVRAEAGIFSAGSATVRAAMVPVNGPWALPRERDTVI